MQPLILMVLMFGVFYFLLIRPQVKRQKKQQAMLDALEKGDEIITRGGIIGRITGVSGQKLVVEIQEKVRIRLLRSAIESKYDAKKFEAGEAASSAKAAKSKSAKAKAKSKKAAA